LAGGFRHDLPLASFDFPFNLFDSPFAAFCEPPWATIPLDPGRNFQKSLPFGGNLRE
jgi:hypothetical protein